nr:CoA-transferase [Brachyspira hyodysenteriae]
MLMLPCLELLEVDEKGNLANWMVPGKMVPGMGGAMDLVVGSKAVIVAMEHTAKGSKKILKNCTLPLTAKNQVNKIITEKGVMNITDKGIELVEIFSTSSVEDIQANTEAKLIISENLKKVDVL